MIDRRIAATLALSLAATASLAGPPLVIYSEIPGDPTAEAPGLGIDFTGLLGLNASPNGQHWIFKGFIDDTENDVIVIGFGLTGAVVAREEGPTPIGGTTHSFLDSDCGINDLGMYAYGSRLNGTATNADEVIFTANAAVAQESFMAPGLTDPGGAGDEIYGNSLNSPSVLADGTVCYRADLIDNIDTDFESALYIGASVAAQEGTMALTGETFDSFAALSGNTFSVSPDGSAWIVEADIDPSPFASLESVVVSGSVVLQEGDEVFTGSLPVDAVFAVEMAANGDWYARGDFTDNTDWVVRNGSALAFTGGAVDSGDFENWSDVISGVTGNINGDYLIAGETDNPDTSINAVVSLNGTTVVMREGDGVDLDGNGMADDGVEINTFSANDLVLATDGTIYAFVTLRQAGNGAAMGDAFIRLLPSDIPCSGADLAEPFGTLDFNDVVAYLNAFSSMGPAADLAPPMGVLDFNDVVAYLNLFAAGCP